MARTNTNTGGGGGGSGTVEQVDTIGPITGGPITTTGSIGITQATTSTDGYLSSTDWNTFNGKGDTLFFDANTIDGDGTLVDPYTSRLQMSLTSDASGVKLSGDVTSPGNNYVYGTNGSGTRGWLPQSALIVPISTLANATGNGSAAVGNNVLNWTWNTLTSGSGLSLTSTSTASTGTSQSLLNIEMSGAHVASNVQTIGLNINNAHTGSGSKNVGILSVTGSGSDNYSLLANNKVAIGHASSPSSSLPNLLTVGALGVNGSIGITNGAFGKNITLAVPASNFTNWTMTFPDTPGNSGEVQISNGAGVMSWAALPTTVTPGGSDTEIQFNNSGAFGASSNFTFNSGTSALTLTGAETINGGVGTGLTVNSDGAQALVVAGNSLPGTFLSSGGVTNGEMGIFENVQSFGIATYTNSDQITSNATFWLANHKFSHDLTNGITYVGDPQNGDAVLALIGATEVAAQGTYNGSNSTLFSTDFVNGLASIGDLSSSANGTQFIVDDFNQKIQSTAKYFIDTGAVATDAMTIESAGGSVTIADGVRGIYYDPASAQNLEDFILPNAPVDGQEIVVVFGGQITSGASVITNINVLPSNTQVVLGAFSTVYKSGESFSMKYREDNNSWYKIY